MANGSVEKYIETIYELELSHDFVRVKDIANALGVTYPSVSEMLGKLAKDGLIDHGKYRHVTLTVKGAGIARKLDKKHETIKRFFIDILGVNEETADVDACEIEHVMSDETLKKLVSYLESNPEIKKRS